MESKAPLWQKGLTRRQMQILEELNGRGPELAEAYSAALRLISDDSIPARVYLLAHIVREIANRIPDYLDVPIDKRRVEYESLLDEIARLWQEGTEPQASIAEPKVGTRLLESEEPSRQARGVSISLHLYRALDRLVAAHNESRQTRRESVRRLLRSGDVEGSSLSDSHLDPIVEHWMDLTRWFAGRVHLRAADKEPPDFQQCVDKFHVFEGALYALVCPFYGAVEELDAILEETNRPTS